MKARRIDELDAMARAYLDGDVNRLDVLGLSLFDMFYVMTLASVFSCARVGTISGRECVKMRYHVAMQYRQLTTLQIFWEMQHEQWIENTKKYSGKSCELTREIAKDEPDAVKFIGGLCELLDLLTGENVLHKLFVKRIEDEDFKKSCQIAVVERGDEWRGKFEKIRDEDYMIMLERFYAATDENGMAQVFASLEPDELRNKVRQAPVKNDDTRTVAEGIRKMYGERYKGKV